MTPSVQPARREVAPMLLEAWGEALAPIIASMIVAQPDLGRRFALAPKRVIHAIAIVVQHGLSEGRDATDIAAGVVTQDVRDLLAKAVPQPHARLFGVLSHVEGKAAPLDFYLRLNRVLSGPASSVLCKADSVTPGLLDVLERAAGDHVLLAAATALGTSPVNLDAMASILAYLRATGRADEIERLPEGAGWQAIVRRVKADAGHIQAPMPPFQQPEGWRRVPDMAALWAIGRSLENCVASMTGAGYDHLRQFAAGQAVFLVRDAEPVVLAMVLHVGPELWAVSQIAGKKNRRCPPEVEAQFTEALAAALAPIKHRLIAQEPWMAMYSLGWRVGEDSQDLDEIAEQAA